MLQIAVNHSTAFEPSVQRCSLVPQLRALAAQVTVRIQSGQIEQAKHVVHQYTLPPIAWGFLATCLLQNAIASEMVERVLT